MDFEIACQDGSRGGHLGLPIGTILATFDLQITPIIPIKFRVNWPYDLGEGVQNRPSKCRTWPPSWISDSNDFSFTLIYKSPQ